jgi:tetratricopeptide (TPR) repeat protein
MSFFQRLPAVFLAVGILVALSSPSAHAADSTPPTAAASDPAADSRAALGWKNVSGRSYDRYEDGSAFSVQSPPAQWSAALETTKAWVAAAPNLDNEPAAHLLARLARLQALALNATDPAVLAELRAERAALGGLARRLKETAGSAAGESRYRTDHLAQVLERLTEQLGLWLADSPADHLALFREKLDALRPAGREKLAARYGGEEKLGVLLGLAREYARLRADAEAARKTLAAKPADPAAQEAARKAMAAMGYFQGYHFDNEPLGQLLSDPVMAAELGGAQSWTRLASLEIPALVELAGEAEAAKLLTEAFALPANLRLGSSSLTRALARRLIIAGQLVPRQVPEELLGEWPDGRADMVAAQELVALYDALKARFPELAKPKTTDAEAAPITRSGDMRYLARTAYALAAVGRDEEAMALLKASGATDPHFPYHAPIEAKLAQAAWDFLAKLDGNTPTDESWGTLRSLAPNAGRAKELAVLADKHSKAAAPGSAAATRWQLRHGDALLAAGDTDAALAVMLPIFNGGVPGGDKALAEDWAEAAGRLLKLARVLPRPELDGRIREKLGAEFKNPRSLLWHRSSDLFADYALEELAASRFAALEAMLRARLAAKPSLLGGLLRSVAGVENDDESYSSAEEHSAWIADLLARQGKHKEALQWLAESPHWEQSDLVRSFHLGGDGGFRELALVAAEALHATGRGPEGIAIIEAYLIQRPDHDPAYTLLATMRGPAALPFLARLRDRDRFQNRPLIWQAKILLDAGRTAEADAAVKQAIVTDPSDGHQPHGDRMRAYAVAAEIATKQGDAAQAEFFRRIVTAIRRAEAADDVAAAGLTGRAIEEYKAALISFADAYCIQSRLGRDLAEEGRATEAAEHFRRAFELMPDSFGRVESHCFGCESAFAGRERQRIAEEVFTALLAKPTVRPQTYYLMGYLRQEQGRWEEAAGWFTQAVEADPDYLNAWGRLADALPRTARPRNELDRVAFRRLALDPYHQHGAPGLAEVRDLRGLWQAAATAQPADALKLPEKLFPLGDKAPPRKAQSGRAFSDTEDNNLPATVLARHNAMSAIVDALDEVYSALRM